MSLAFVAIDSCVKFEINYTWGDSGKKLANILHFQPQTGLVDYAAQITTSNCNTWMASWVSNMMSNLSQALVLVSVVATDLGSEFGAQASSNSTPAGGSVSANPVPSSVACLAQFGTSHRSRTGRGRVFIPGATEDRLTDVGTWSSGFTGQIVDGLNAFNSSIGAALASGFQMAVASKKDATAYQILSITCNSQVAASQDRRELNRS
jgi:hypothetical protein